MIEKCDYEKFSKKKILSACRAPKKKKKKKKKGNKQNNADRTQHS
jgi:hypothetical protein